MTAFTTRHALGLRLVRHAGFLGDGPRAFCTVVAIDEALVETCRLSLVALDGSGAEPLAPELEDIDHPVAAPDGLAVAAVAAVDDTPQVVIVPVDGAPARPLTALPQGASGPLAWSPDGTAIAFCAGPSQSRDPSSPYRVDRVTFRSEGIGLLDDAVTDVHVVDVVTGDVRRLTDDRCMNGGALAWSPDGRSLAYTVAFDPEREWDLRAALHVVDLADGRARTVVDAAWGGVRTMAWLPEGERLAFIGARRASGLFGAHAGHVWVVDAGGGVPECRTTTLRAGAGIFHLQCDLPMRGALAAARLCVDGDAAYVAGQRGGEVIIHRVALSGPQATEPVVHRGDGCAFLLDQHPAHGVLHLAMTLLDPPELTLDGRRLMALNDALLAEAGRPVARKLDAVAPDGLHSEAWALTPDGNGPWPALLSIHGGPWAATGCVFTIEAQRLVAAGFAVVAHNFRGSSGYGEAFSALIGGDWGAAAADHHAALDAAIAAGIADPDRLGVFGLSHGGFATCWLLGTSHRFRAGVAENPATSFEAFYGTTDTSWWMPAEFGGTPDDAPETYRERSPLIYARDCRTPLLLVVGEDDLCCNPLHAEQQYRVLKRIGTPVEMLRLPGAAHNGSNDGPVAGRIAQDEALVAWFERYLSTEGVVPCASES